MVTVLDQVIQSLPNVEGKVFAITGTTSGTGFVAAQTVAEQGGEVICLNRASDRVEASLNKLREAVPDGKFVPIECDLLDFASVRQAALEINEKYDKIYCLANNAGIIGTSDTATKDGMENQMQVNHLSHFLLTSLLFPKISKAAKEYGDARIVQHSSVARALFNKPKNGPLEEKYLGPGGKFGNGGTAITGEMGKRYAQSKLANSVFCCALHDKLSANSEHQNIRSLCAHPGLSTTNIFAAAKTNMFVDIVLWIGSMCLFQTPANGAAGLIKCMMGEAESGNIYGPDGIKGPPVKNELLDIDTDAKAKDMLWSVSEKVTAQTFDL